MQAQNLRQVRLGGELVSAQQLWDRTAAYHKQSKLAAGALHLTKLHWRSFILSLSLMQLSHVCCNFIPF